MNPCGGCGSQVRQAPQPCPLCHQNSEFVHQPVVQSVAKQEIQSLIVEERYYVCANDDCPVVFFDGGKEQILLLEDVNLQADFAGVTKGGQSCSTCTRGCKQAGTGCAYKK